MVAAQLSGAAAVSCGLSSRTSKWAIPSKGSLCFPLKPANIVNGGLRSLSLDREKRFLPYPVILQRKHFFPKFNSQTSSDDDLHPNKAVEKRESGSSNSSEELSDDLNGPLSFHIDEKVREHPDTTAQSQIARRELLLLSLPAIGGQAIEPMVQLMETAYIGHLGSVELASAGVSITLFNIVSKLFNIPLLSVATSFVAEDISKNASKFSTSEKMKLSSVSTALTLAIGIGIFEAMALSLGSGTLLSLMGISPVSSMRVPAQRFLLLRAIGAPAFVVSLALQGIFRGFKDTKTPVFCLSVGNFSAIFLFPLFMYYCRLGVYGAAISTVVSQYIVTISMIWYLNKRAVLLPPKLGELQFDGYLKSGGFLIGRTLAVLLTMALGTSMAARQGPVAMAAHQICVQVWLAVSLLSDAIAASAQALIAGYVSKDDYRTVKDITQFVLKIGCVTGVSLAIILGVSFGSLAPLFTKDIEVLGVVRNGLLFVSASQPINALAFIFDGLHYGVSDFRYAALSMMMVGAISSAFLLYAPKVFGLPGVWAGLTLFMGLRAVAGFIRILQPRGPWWFLHGDVLKPEIFAMNTTKKKRHVIGVQILQGIIFRLLRRCHRILLIPVFPTVSGCLLLLFAILMFLSPPISNHINTSLNNGAPHIGVEEEGTFRVPMKGESSGRDLWSWNQSNLFHGCSSSNSIGDYPTAEMRTRPKRYLLIATSGGLNQQRTGIVDSVVAAYIMNATLVVPKLDQESFWKDASNFSDIFDVDWFIGYLSTDVKIIKQLPEKAGKVITTRVPRKCNQKCYEARILPIFHKKRVQAVQLTKFDYRLSNRLDLELQKLRCRVNYHALKFTDPILEMGMQLVERMRMKSKHYVSLHLRFESDMLAFSGCYYGGGDKEMKDLGTIRKRWKTLHTKNPDRERRHGKCPLTPEEVGLMLRALGFGNDVHIYVASGEVYGGEETLAPLKALFPNFHTKETIASKEELARFSPYSSRMAALDFIVCDESQVFVANNNGNMAKILAGKRRYFGHKTTIRPNARKLYRIFDDRHNMTWEEFASLVQKFQSGFMGEPNDLRAGRGEFHEYPLPCICENSESRDLGVSTPYQGRAKYDKDKGRLHGGEGGFFTEDEQDLSETEYEQDRKLLGYSNILMKQ